MKKIGIIVDNGYQGLELWVPSYFFTICHFTLLPAEVDLLNGKNVTGNLSIKPEMENAGATYMNLPVVRAPEQILCGRTHVVLGIFMPGIMKLVRSL